jgi:hypothetical protein
MVHRNMNVATMDLFLLSGMYAGCRTCTHLY